VSRKEDNETERMWSRRIWSRWRFEASENNGVPGFSYSGRIKTTRKGLIFVVVFNKRMTGMK
jgi:hypothetical protein